MLVLILKIYLKDEISEQVILSLIVLRFLHSLFCPFIYALNLKDFQAACRKLFSTSENDSKSWSNIQLRSTRGDVSNQDNDSSCLYTCSEDENECENPQNNENTNNQLGLNSI